MFRRLKLIFAAPRDREAAAGTPDNPFAQPEDASGLVRERRARRRLKAGLSVGLAVAAGAFISCQRMLGQGEQAEGDAGQAGAPPEGRAGQGSDRAAELATDRADAGSAAESALDAGSAAARSDADEPDAGAGLAVDAGASRGTDAGDEPSDAATDQPSEGATSDPTPADALAVPDAGAIQRRPPKPRPKVDLREHRKGMPVIDNLVE